MVAGEFELHANCWMGWPDSGYLWRDDAKPAQEQYAEVAKAISQFEPVVMMANPEVSAGLSSPATDHCYVVHVLCHALETAPAFHVPSARFAVVQAYVLLLHRLQFYANSMPGGTSVCTRICSRSTMHGSRFNAHDHASDAIDALTIWAALYHIWLRIKLTLLGVVFFPSLSWHFNRLYADAVCCWSQGSF